MMRPVRWRQTLLIGVVGLLLAACGRTWSDAGFAQVEDACVGQGAGSDTCACVRLQVENLIPFEQFGTDTGSEKLAGILADCQDGQPSDERTALGWWWDFVYYDLLGANIVLMFIVGWELFLGGVPLMVVISLVQLIFF
jgi:hypothetical protein